MKAYYNDIDPYCCAVLRKNIVAGNLPEGDVDARDIREVRGSELMEYGHIHLFAGIGAFPLGFHRAGIPSHWRIITGGFPCQPHSLAGQRQASKDERNLWPELCRIIREFEPDWFVAENVLGLLSSEDGAFFGAVLRDLAEAGYDAEWICLRASDFGAPHRRERIFIVAYPNSKQLQRGRDIGELAGATGEGQSTEEEWQWLRDATRDSGKTMAHASSSGWQERDSSAIAGEQGHVAWRNLAPGIMEDSTIRRERQYQESRGESRPQPLFEQPGARNAQSLLGRVFDGVSSWLDRYQWPVRPGEQQHEWEPTRTTQEKVPYRVARLQALGNAIVVPCAEYIGRCIMEASK